MLSSQFQYASMAASWLGIPYVVPMVQMIRSAACLIPIAVSVGTDSIPGQEEKLAKIKRAVENAKADLNINSNVNIRISENADQVVDNALMIGSTWSIGGPVMLISRTWFDKFGNCNDPEFATWTQALNELPNEPRALAKALSVMPTDQRATFKTQTKKFQNYQTEDQMSGIIAHELGHAKYHHGLSATCITGVALRTLNFMRFALGTYLDAKKQPFYCSDPHPTLPLFIKRPCTLNDEVVGTHYSSKFFNYVTIPIALMFIYQLSRKHERQADTAICCNTTYQEGLGDFFKKDLIINLLDDQESPDKAIEKFIGPQSEVISTHPHAANRLAYAASLNKTVTASPAITTTEKIVAALGIAILLSDLSEALGGPYLKMPFVHFTHKESFYKGDPYIFWA